MQATFLKVLGATLIAATTIRGYGRPTVEDMAEALKKFPRYNLDEA